jgi:hypothetical protein
MKNHNKESQMDLKNWISQARASWQENNPTLYKELNRAGKLSVALKDAAERTHQEMSELEANGYSNQEAWEMTREKYLLLPAEQEPDEVTSKGPSLFNEANALQSQILQSNEEPEASQA